jgi:hypothetical protein
MCTKKKGRDKEKKKNMYENKRKNEFIKIK